MRIRTLALLALVACGSPQTQPAPPPEPPPQEEVPPSPVPPEPNETPAESAPPDAAPAPVAGGCTSHAECGKGQMCQGPPGCGAPWTCGPAKPCTKDLVTYCGCDGQEFKGSGSCPQKPYVNRGPCKQSM